MTKCGHRPTAGGCGRGSEPRGRGPCDIDRATPGAAGRRGSRYKSWVQVPEVRIEFLYSIVQTSSTFPVAWIYLVVFVLPLLIPPAQRCASGNRRDVLVHRPHRSLGHPVDQDVRRMTVRKARPARE